MNTQALHRALVRTLGVALILATEWASAQHTYRLTDLGNVGGNYSLSEGYDINVSGQVTGDTYSLDNTARHAFLWDGSAMRDLGTLGGSTSTSSSINDSGQVAGVADTTGDLGLHAFLWNGTTMQDLGTLGGGTSGAGAINNSGQVVGGADTTTGFRHAFLWDGSAMIDLGTLGGTASYAGFINDAGQVAGGSNLAGDAAQHAFLWNRGTMQDLGTFGGARSRPADINASGQVTGWASTTRANISHAFLWDGASLQDLGTLGGTNSYGAAINDSGQVTGFADATTGFSHAFLWDGTMMIDLQTLSGMFDSSGAAINAYGQVVGYVTTTYDGDPHAFLWDGSSMHDLNELIDSADPLRPCVTLGFGKDINDHGQILANGHDSCLNEWHAYLVAVSPTVTTRVPNVVGMTQAAATTAITDAGFVLGTVTLQASSTVASGYVIGESPVAGTMASPGSTVDLVVSTGSAPAVPDVVGMTQAAATTAITDAGFVLGTVTLQASSTVASGYVIGESPVAGTMASPGSTVDLVVSTGSGSGGSGSGGGGYGGGGALDSLTLSGLLVALALGMRRRRSKEGSEPNHIWCLNCASRMRP